MCSECAEQLSLCSDSSRCVKFRCAPLFRTRVTGAQRSFLTRGVDKETCGSRPWEAPNAPFAVANWRLSTFCGRRFHSPRDRERGCSEFTVFCVRFPAETLPGVTWTVNQRLVPPRLCYSLPRRKLHEGFRSFESGKCWHGRLGSTEVSEEWEVGWGAGFGQELRGETRFPAVWRTLHLRDPQPREVLQAALVLPSGLVSL